jgi:hypothetical protein
VFGLVLITSHGVPSDARGLTGVPVYDARRRNRERSKRARPFVILITDARGGVGAYWLAFPKAGRFRVGYRRSLTR